MMMKTISLYCLFIFAIVTTHAQIVKIMPAKPVWGDTVVAQYNCNNASAALNNNEQVYARIVAFMQDGHFEKYTVTPLQQQGILSAYFIVPANAASLRIQWYTLNREDDNAVNSVKLFTKDKRHFVEGAYMEDFFTDNPQQTFAKETAQYPYSYFAWARYFNVVAMVQPGTAKTIINPLLHKADSAYRNKKITPGLLSALCVGYAKTGDLSNAKKYLCRLLTMFPAAGEAAFTLSIYNYEYYKASGRDIEDDIKDSVKQIFIHYPQSALAGDANIFYTLSSDSSIPLKSFEDVFVPRYNAGQVEYYALGQLANLYIDRNIKIDSANAMITSIIAMYNNATIHHQYYLSPSRHKMYVGELLASLARIAAKQQDFTGVIMYTSAALNTIDGSNIQGNLSPTLFALRATAYTQLDNKNLAMEDYKALYKNGDKSILDSMKNIFPSTAHTQKRFDEFLTSIDGNTAQSPGTNIVTAPAFSGIDMAGDTITLSSLKGKTVVLNYWGTGCGPCIAEMPALNALVEQNKQRTDVVFIAATLDDKESLQAFLKKKKFDYRVLMATPQFVKDYNIDALPVHLVVGKNGNILNRSVGARADIKEFLQGIIDRD